MASDNDSKKLWVGDAAKGGVTQRLGTACFILSVVLVVLSFNAPGNASIRYWLFFAAHGLVYSGFVVGAIADRVAGRPFDRSRLAYAAIAAIVYLMACPIVMAAAHVG